MKLTNANTLANVFMYKSNNDLAIYEFLIDMLAYNKPLHAKNTHNPTQSTSPIYETIAQIIS